MKTGNRKSGLDVVRCVALLFIIGVHFFYYNGYYWKAQVGVSMFVADMVRWLTFSCVSIFIMLTGYLKAEKKYDREHYKGLVAVIVTWIVTSIICLIFKEAYLNKGQSFGRNLLDFFQFKGADYAWYIELYIGLFMLIPFLNEMFGWNKSKKYHVGLLITLVFTAFVPALVNDVSNEVLKDSLPSNVTGEIFPNYFAAVWPFAYYFCGCFIRKYKPKVNKLLCVVIVVIFGAMRAARTFICAKGGNFYDGIGGGYTDFYVGVMTVFVFLLFYNLEIKNNLLKRILAHISQRALHIYLLSSIADALFNPLIINYNEPMYYWWAFPVRVLWVFVVSLLMSELVYPISARIGGVIIDVFFNKNIDSESEDLLLK